MTLIQRIKCFFGYHENEQVPEDLEPRTPFKIAYHLVCKHCGHRHPWTFVSMGDPRAVEDLYPKKGDDR